MKRLVTLFIAALLLPAVLSPGGAGGGAGAEWRSAERGYRWSFPGDLAAHPDFATEWWYVTGHLQNRDEPAEELAFQLTFFRIGLTPAGRPDLASDWAAGDLLMAHASVLDPDGDGRAFSEVLWRAAPLLGGFGAPGDSVLAWCRAPAGGAGVWRLVHSGEEFRLQVRDDPRKLRYELSCRPVKEVVYHGDGGFSPKNKAATVASLYFSFPRLEVEGTVYRAGRPLAVVGTAWLDREIFSNTLADEQTGWDWVSLQLDDGRDLMLYRLRGVGGKTDFALGTLVDPQGRSISLPAEQWSLTPRKHWTSPETGSRYPVAWRLEVPGREIDLLLEPVVPDQENVSARSGVHYWEGAVRARKFDGDPVEPVGRGFVELTGYGEGSRPPV